MPNSHPQIDGFSLDQIQEVHKQLEGPDQKDHGDVYRQIEKIQSEGEALIASNRELCSSVKAAYGRLLGMLDKKDPLRAEIQEKLKALGETLRVLSDDEQ